MEETHILAPPARLTLFGFAATAARVRVAVRTRSWRVTRALFIGLGTLGITPLVALVPPHLPWALLSAGAGGVLALRRLRERTTLLAMEGTCPRCGAAQALEAPVPLADGHRFPCQACHHELGLEVDLSERRVDSDGG
ncbi:MAG TPA: hypothetical protein VMK65_08885 [Longimicrobiales bacterium]|nr:hypothetical protein [Longimicrobiales bacterium]